MMQINRTVFCYFCMHRQQNVSTYAIWYYLLSCMQYLDKIKSILHLCIIARMRITLLSQF